MGDPAQLFVPRLSFVKDDQYPFKIPIAPEKEAEVLTEKLPIEMPQRMRKSMIYSLHPGFNIGNAVL